MIVLDSVDPDEMLHYFIWVFTVCLSTHLGIYSIQRANCYSYITYLKGRLASAHFWQLYRDDISFPHFLQYQFSTIFTAYIRSN